MSTAPPTSPTPQPSSAAVPQHSTAKYVIFGVVMTAFLIADQASKIWVQRNLRLYKDEVHIIDGFLSFIHAENPGAAFGIGIAEQPQDVGDVFAVGCLHQERLHAGI